MDLHIATFPSQRDNYSPTDCNPRVCQPCRLVPPPFARAISYGDYQGNLRALIHLLKFESVQPLAQLLGNRLARALATTGGTAFGAMPRTLTVVPVPLWHARQKARGFNQAALLAAVVMKKLHEQDSSWRMEPAFHALGRQRATEAQTGRTGRQRRLNLKGAFYVRDPKKIAGKDLLLVDDVFTTGATARECAKTLADAGANSIWVATVAQSRLQMGYSEVTLSQ